ncbi:uncharacterized protein LOC143256370 isoform X2 [Tachypleus tridentatus]|uniref:uncharacterized protein LOC143256370 isoform X2 n=1 Tax=Tachypleus tridentatus TaxID=6853 RepID=UPI003FCF7A87
MTSSTPRTTVGRLVGLVVTFLIRSIQVHSQIPENVDFSPTVTGKCDRGEMTILVTTTFPFQGVVHIRDFRKSPCIAYGNGSPNITLKISLLTDHDDPTYCGVEKGRGGGSHARSVVVAVRAHKKLETSDDKFYLIACGKSGFVNARNELSQVHLNFMEDYKKVNELLVGRQYLLRVGLSQGKDFYDIAVRDCYGFDSNTTEVELIDSEGCSKTHFLSKFRFNKTARAADAVLFSTFKFPNTRKVHLQCDVILCKESCPQFQCQQNREELPQPLPQSQGQENENVQLLASTTVFVLEPGQDVSSG